MENTKVLYDQKLVELFNNNLKDEKNTILRITQTINDAYNKYNMLLSLNFINKINFLHTLFIENNF